MLLEDYRDKWERITISTEPVNRSKAEGLITEFYALMDLPKPKFKWVDSPHNPDVGAMKLYEITKNRDNISGKSRHVLDGTQQRATRLLGRARTALPTIHGLVQVPVAGVIHNVTWNTKLSGFHYGNFDWWMAFDHQYINNYTLREHSKTTLGRHFIEAIKPAIIATRIAEQVPWWRPHKDVCLVSERPTRISYIRNEFNRIVITNKNESAIQWGHKNWYLIDGVLVPDYFVTNPSMVTIKDCLVENIEVRRIAVDIFGRDNFIKQGRGKIVDHDERYGTLWEVEVTQSRTPEWRRWRESVHSYILEVINRSPEPDGSFKHYYLRVPPPEFIAREFRYQRPKRTALEAVAWTFGLKWNQYAPELET